MTRDHAAEARDLRALLTAVLDAITLPRADPDYEQRLVDRADLAAVTGGAALDGALADIGWHADYLAGRLDAENARRTRIRAAAAAERGEGQ
ncbi:hypothetical protein ACIQNU_03440 [Streptomyces sp. NPDC091292]|uniref:hypothetical protein n=1 Tax=Streptomyces sp. NPDC091292 TaxID=3365991 RepID=UPI0037FCFA5E